MAARPGQAAPGPRPEAPLRLDIHPLRGIIYNHSKVEVVYENRPARAAKSGFFLSDYGKP